MSVLDEICERKRAHVAERKKASPVKGLEEKIDLQDKPRGFIKRLEEDITQGRYGLICEVKKASPSKGLIRADFQPASLAQSYERGGASCISVLTDEPYFQGSDAYLPEVKSAVTLPVLRKDFMIDPYQIIESRSLGADCILLILSALSDSQALEMESLAHELGMDVLIEVHDEQELDRAGILRSKLVGVNNRNLKTMTQSIEISIDLAKKYPQTRLPVSESGLGSPEDLGHLSKHGYHCFLIGETFMRQPDVEAAVRAFQKG